MVRTGYIGNNTGFGSDEISTVGGSQDIFISKLNTNGDFEWTKSSGGEESDGGEAITLGTEGIIRATGYFRDYSMTIGITPLENSGGDDVFVWNIYE